MNEKILVPVLGESITEATVAKWLKKIGDKVETDEPIIELETDKVNLEVPSPINGVLSEINAKDGQVVEVGTVLGQITFANEKKIIDNLNDANSSPDLFNDNIIKLEKPLIDKQKKQDEPEPLVLKREEPLILNNEIKTKTEFSKDKNKEILSPSVRKIVEENILIQEI